MHAKCDVINLLRPPPGRSSAGPLRWFKIGLDDRPRLHTRDDRDDFERHACAAPLENRCLNQPEIVGAHELEAAGKVAFDPAVDIFEPLRSDRPSWRRR